jgi:hypothetical protein
MTTWLLDAHGDLWTPASAPDMWRNPRYAQPRSRTMLDELGPIRVLDDTGPLLADILRRCRDTGYLSVATYTGPRTTYAVTIDGEVDLTADEAAVLAALVESWGEKP